MRRTDFLNNVRESLLFLAPRVEVDNPYSKPDVVENLLRANNGWLTQRAVADFRVEDFNDLPTQQQAVLQQSVDRFSAVARDVQSPQAATTEQRSLALPHFLQIFLITQKMLIKEWLDTATTLVTQAEGWAGEEGWPTKRYPKTIAEDFIGTYQLDKLVFSAEGSQLALIPVGRFAPRCEGIFELAVMPAYDSVMVLRQSDQWIIHPYDDDTAPTPWTKPEFVKQCLTLARLP